jgi:hypothetical protein
MDTKLSFFAGWLFATASTINIMGFFQAALVGLVGGFFGLLGKELYFLAKSQIKEIKPSAKSWIASKIDWIKGKF